MPWNPARNQPARELSQARLRLIRGQRNTCCLCSDAAKLRKKIASWPVSRVLYGTAPEGDGTWQPFIWDYACAQPRATHPDDGPGNRLDACAPVSSLFGLAPGGVYRAVHVAMAAVGSYPTLSPLLRMRSGLLSVALSLGSPPPDVIRHRVSVEPGLSSPRGLSALAERGCPANWQRLINRPAQQAPEKSDDFTLLAPARSAAWFYP